MARLEHGRQAMRQETNDRLLPVIKKAIEDEVFTARQGLALGMLNLRRQQQVYDEWRKDTTQDVMPLVARQKMLQDVNFGD